MVSEDDQPTEGVNDPGPPWAPGGHVGYGPAGSPAGSDRPEQRWYGADRWRNHWQEQPAEDDEPPAGATRQDVYGTADDPDADPGAAETRRDYGPTDPAPRASGSGQAMSQEGVLRQ